MRKIAIVERTKTIREGIKIFINRFSEFECCGSFSEYEAFREKLSELKPDILLIDLNHSGISILNEISNLKKNHPEMLIIVLTMNDENELLFETLIHGASAYLNKNSPSQKIIRTLEDISNGKTLVNSLIARKTVKYINENKISENYHELELNLLNKVTEGNNLFAIEKSLNISNDEIRVTFNNIYKKLQSQKIGFQLKN